MDSEELRKKISVHALYVSIFLLSFVLFNLLIATILFIFRVGIQSWYLPVSFVLSTILMILLMKHRKMIKINSILIIIALPILVTCGLTISSGEIYDYTWDGNSYHKLAIGMMMDGWNPLIETEYEFNEKNGEIINLGGEEFNWGDNYAKASHIFSANVGKITGNVESGKVLNAISMIIVFLMIFSLCLHIGKNWFFSILFAFVVVTPTTVVSQLMTNYVDLLVYLYMFLLAALFFWFEYGKEYQKEILGVFFATLVMLINIKFSSFAYAGVLCAFYYGWYIYRYKKEKKFDKKFFKRFSLTAFAAVLVGVFVVGLSVYPKNLVVHGHPFYPLMGEGKRDIMTLNSPYYFREKNNLEKFFIATFGEMANISAGVSDEFSDEAKLKVPFTINEGEMEYIRDCDLRISGNGVFFSGVLIVSVLVIIVFARRLFKDDKKLFIMLALPIVMTITLIIVMSDVWWARYFPQLHFVVFAALIILDKYKSKISIVVLYGLIAVLIANNMMFLSGANEVSNEYKEKTEMWVKAYKSTYSPDECNVLLSSPKFAGAFYNARHDLSEYDIVYEDFRESEVVDYMPVVVNFVIARCQKK